MSEESGRYIHVPLTITSIQHLSPDKQEATEPIHALRKDFGLEQGSSNIWSPSLFVGPPNMPQRFILEQLLTSNSSQQAAVPYLKAILHAINY
jgi:hypothetical protein